MSKSIPPTIEIRDWYADTNCTNPECGNDGLDCPHALTFDRWLATVKAGAWDAAIAEAAEQGTIQIPENPYREQETP